MASAFPNGRSRRHVKRKRSSASSSYQPPLCAVLAVEAAREDSLVVSELSAGAESDGGCLRRLARGWKAFSDLGVDFLMEAHGLERL